MKTMTMTYSKLGELVGFLRGAASFFGPHANPHEVSPIMAPFDKDTVANVSDLKLITHADYGGAIKLCQIDAQSFITDPDGLDHVVEMVPPIGGWLYVRNVDFPDAVGPVTIYGYALLTTGAADIIGMAELTTPVVLDFGLDAFELPPIRIKFPTAAFQPATEGV